MFYENENASFFVYLFLGKKDKKRIRRNMNGKVDNTVSVQQLAEVFMEREVMPVVVSEYIFNFHRIWILDEQAKSMDGKEINGDFSGGKSEILW